jgi:hypothetical protein
MWPADWFPLGRNWAFNRESLKDRPQTLVIGIGASFIDFAGTSPPNTVNRHLTGWCDYSHWHCGLWHSEELRLSGNTFAGPIALAVYPLDDSQFFRIWSDRIFALCGAKSGEFWRCAC